MRIVVLLAVLLMSTSCSKADGGHVELRVVRDVWMLNGNLNQKELRTGDEVVATCFALAPNGFPGPVVKVLSNFDVSASVLQDRLPDCGSTGLS
jgi:hypothetical protein